MDQLDLYFPLIGLTIPSNSGYPLYAAICTVIPEIHAPDFPLAIAPIRGNGVGQRIAQLPEGRARLRLRLPSTHLARLLPLAGKALNVAGHRLQVGVPQVEPLHPAPTLFAQMVTIKRSDRKEKTRTKAYMDPDGFMDAIRRKLVRLEIRGEAGIPLCSAGPRQGLPRRRVLFIGGCKIVGFSVQVTGLSAEESIRLQERGLGGRKKMGCGFFVPLVPRLS